MDQNSTFKANGTDAQNRSNGLDVETLRNIRKIAELDREHREDLKFSDRAAGIIAVVCGSTPFAVGNGIFFGGWIILNSAFPRVAFDPYPFTFLTLVVSLEAIFLSVFILISQNNESKLTERWNHLDLQINMLTEQENTKMLEILELIAKKVGVALNDPAMEALKQSVEPGTIIEQIASEGFEKLPPKKG